MQTRLLPILLRFRMILVKEEGGNTPMIWDVKDHQWKVKYEEMQQFITK